MSRLHRSTSRTSLQLGLLLCTASALAACEVHTTWGTGSSSSGGEVSEEPSVRRPRNANGNDDAAARERARRRRARADEESARIDREARERVAQAEHDAAERERAAEAEAEHERQQAAADAEQRKREAEEAAATTDKAQKTMHRRQATGRFDMGTQGASGAPNDKDKDEVFERRNTEISQSTEEKKATIRKQLEQNKSDILVAAERKRTEVQESLKDQPEKKP